MQPKNSDAGRESGAFDEVVVVGEQLGTKVLGERYVKQASAAVMLCL